MELVELAFCRENKISGTNHDLLVRLQNVVSVAVFFAFSLYAVDASLVSVR